MGICSHERYVVQKAWFYHFFFPSQSSLLNSGYKRKKEREKNRYCTFQTSTVRVVEAALVEWSEHWAGIWATRVLVHILLTNLGFWSSYLKPLSFKFLVGGTEDWDNWIIDSQSCVLWPLVRRGSLKGFGGSPEVRERLSGRDSAVTPWGLFFFLSYF